MLRLFFFFSPSFTLFALSHIGTTYIMMFSACDKGFSLSLFMSLGGRFFGGMKYLEECPCKQSRAVFFISHVGPTNMVYGYR